ncbi:WecB/TagA/CpsF family glycosyltransferase [Pseudoflavonifractor sp. 524-17]|uniref:WecB/TagA/CpsF family glycosyltransferase n=1 Tax=Pseudoflavonifractor sp. 524-17 TaxID=2304577 RepID=UPI00325A4731
MDLKTEVLGVRFDDLSLEEMVHTAASLIEAGGFHYAVTPNPEFILSARDNEAFREVLNQADLSMPDGIGVIYASRILGRPLKGRVPGIDFASGLIAWAARTGRRLFLLGSKPGIAELAAASLRGQYPGLTVCGTHDGYFKEDAPVVSAIQEAQADVVLVGLGAPKQELWMAQNGPATGAKFMIGLGGALDVFAGVTQRAPERWQKMGMEWCYRLIHDPKRISRMAKLPLVLVQAAGQRVRGK